MRISKAINIRARRLELVGEAFNVANRRNWTYPLSIVAGSAASPRPTGAAIPREMQVGLRVLF